MAHGGSALVLLCTLLVPRADAVIGNRGVLTSAESLRPGFRLDGAFVTVR